MRFDFAFGADNAARPPQSAAAIPLPSPLFDLDYKTGTYVYPNGINPVAQMLGYVAAAFENADNSLVSQGAYALRRTTRGLYEAPEYTNRVLYNRDLTNGAWVKTNMTVARNQYGRGSTANKASQITATAANATILQPIALASSDQILFADVKRISGSGDIQMTMDGGATWTTLSLSNPKTAGLANSANNGWCRVGIPLQTLTNPSVGFRVANSGDAFGIDYVDLHTYSECPYDSGVCFETTNAAVKYWRDRYTASENTGAGWQPAMRNTYTLFIEFAYRREAGHLITDANGMILAFEADGRLRYHSNPDAPGVNSVATRVRSNTGEMEALNRVVARYDAAAGTASICLNDDSVRTRTGATGLPPTSDHMDFGTNGGGGNRLDGLFGRITLYNSALTDAQMQQLAKRGGA